MTAFDLARARRETRGCEKLIHFNNAGAALPPVPVADALHDYLRDEELHGGYEVMARRELELEHFYVAAARLLNCAPAEIAFAESATRAWNAAFYALKFRPGARILVGSAEYGSSLVAMLQRARNEGVEIVEVPDDGHGQVDLAALERLIDARTRLICLTQVPSGGGLVNPAAAVGQLARRAGIPYLLDACQALGQLPVDVEAIGCDLLCGTGRKFLRGPRGTGLLYVRNSLLETLEPHELNHFAAPMLFARDYRLRPDARRFETWERSYAGQLALGVAIDYALDWGLETISARIGHLAAELRRQLATLDGVTVADRGLLQCGIVTFHARQRPAAELQQLLADRAINVATVPFSANPLSSEQHPHPPLLRASLHYYNSAEEVERFVGELQKLL
ncbi:aminotransferase class V-fold PLP-dependent enzyme [Desulfuromonas carbonis]|uniref:aminotransferase class V-fold PLP-dependent enzyme n=1 Tax=Desulfuromonas sp. DDH964 TaxID=1823759 RepID=UPI00078CEA59|nr:aminotransferase class V-fold PLP-dependent enzyme [Desulfuromonas sp. DDH964]AMV70463.1 cysteine desulfurase [Desulfuromonas sp. DDH964]